MIGTCAVGARIDRRGRIVWCCMPRFDGTALLGSSSKGADDGHLFSIELESLQRTERAYDRGTAIAYSMVGIINCAMQLSAWNFAV